MTTQEIISAIVGFIAGAGISIPITLKFSKSNFNKVNQKNIKSSGDIVGRDKTDFYGN